MQSLHSKHRRIVSSPPELGRGLLQASAHPLALTQTDARSKPQDGMEGPGRPSSAQPTLPLVGLTDPKRKSVFWPPSGASIVGPSQSLHAAACNLGAGQRSVSSPLFGQHLAPLLGPLQGAQTRETTQVLFAQLQRAQEKLQTGLPHERLAAQFETESLKLALLRRDVPQSGSLSGLAAAPVERALESLLAAEVLRQMPPALLAPLNCLAQSLVEQWETLTPEQAERVIKATLQDLRKEFPRPWGASVPLLARLCEGDEPALGKRMALHAFLRRGAQDAPEALATMLLLRSSFMGFKAAGLESTVAPWLKAADLEYTTHILDYKGKLRADVASEPPPDAVAGITAFGERSPLITSSLQAGVRANTRDKPNLDNQAVQDAIRYGNPYASGISGTTNMFLHAASDFNAKHREKIDATALSTALAALLCYDGGHGIHEVYAVSNLLRSLPGLDLSAFQGYAPGHARGMFVDSASAFGVTDLSERAFERLLNHFAPSEP